MKLLVVLTCLLIGCSTPSAQKQELLVASASDLVTALPELYYDEDVRDWNARVAFEQALRDLRRWARHDRRPLAVAVFSSIPSFTPSPARRRFFPQTCAAATEVWEFSLGPDSRLELSCSRAQPRLERGNAVLSKVR